MLRASQTEFNDASRIALRYVFRGSPSRRTHWWTGSPLESRASLPTPHTLLYTEDMNWGDMSRFILDLSCETILGNCMQLEAIDLSVKDIPETQSRRDEALDFVQWFLNTRTNNQSPRFEPIPVHPNQETLSSFQAPSVNPLQTSRALLHAEHGSRYSLPPGTHYSPVVMNAIMKSRSRSLPPPRDSSPHSSKPYSQITTDPKGIVELATLKDQLSRISLEEESVKLPLNQQLEENRIPTESPIEDRYFINPRYIQPPPKKRKSTPASCDGNMLHTVQFQLSDNSMASSRGSQLQASDIQASQNAMVPSEPYFRNNIQAPAVPAASYSRSDFSESSHDTMELQRYADYMAPLPSTAAQLQSYPSTSGILASQYYTNLINRSSSSTSDASIASTSYASLRHTPYGIVRGSQHEAQLAQSYYLNVNSSPSTSASASYTSSIHGPYDIAQGSQHERQRVPPERIAYSTKTSSAIEQDISKTPLYVRWLHQQFARVIENPQPNFGTCEPNRGTPGPNRGDSDSIIGASTANRGASDSNRGTSRATRGTSGSNRGTSWPDRGISEPYPGTSQPNLGTSRPDSKSSEQNPGTSRPNQSRGIASNRSTRRRGGRTKSTNPKTSRSSTLVDWTKTSSSYQRTVYERSPEMIPGPSGSGSSQEGLVPWNLLFPKRSYKRRAKKDQDKDEAVETVEPSKPVPVDPRERQIQLGKI